MFPGFDRWLHDRQPPHGPVILMYHSVQQRHRPDWPYAVSLAAFERQLDFLLEAGYATPTISELVAHPERFAGRVAAITFDDGYVDNLAAWQCLSERGMKATWYVTAGYVGQVPPWDEPGQPRDRLLSAGELRRMAESGMEIGSHTVTHPALPTLDVASAEREVTASRHMLQDLLGRPVESFAYPFGQWDALSEDLVKEAGYRSACLTRTGWGLRDGDPFRLRRLTIYNQDDLGRFARKLAWASHDVGWPQLARRAFQRLLAKA